MIPPLKDLRMRSIRRWLQQSSPESPRQSNPPEALQDRANALDEAMMQDFDQQENALMDSLMKAGTWGTEKGLQAFNTGKMEAWQTICQEYLPTTEPQSED